jgi:hypothetical protein
VPVYEFILNDLLFGLLQVEVIEISVPFVEAWAGNCIKTYLPLSYFAIEEREVFEIRWVKVFLKFELDSSPLEVS